MQQPMFARRGRGVARASVLGVLLALTALLVAMPRSRADGSHVVPTRAVREQAVAPQFTNVRELIRRYGAIHRAKAPSRPIPLGTLVPLSARSSPAPSIFRSYGPNGPGPKDPAPNVVKSFDTLPDEP